MKEIKFYICEHCGNIVGMVNDAGVPLMCCGQKMTKLEAGVTDASLEKHVPVVTWNENTVQVTVGATEHPMTEEHLILWVYLKTDRGGQRKCLKAGDAPVVTFALVDETPLEVYAYCNLHGLWKEEVKKEVVCPLSPLKVALAILAGIGAVALLYFLIVLLGESGTAMLATPAELSALPPSAPSAL